MRIALTYYPMLNGKQRMEGSRDDNHENSDSLKMECGSAKRPRIDESQHLHYQQGESSEVKSNALHVNQETSDHSACEEGPPNIMHEFLVNQTLTAVAKHSCTDTDDDEYPEEEFHFYTQPTEGSIIQDSQPYIHMITDDVDLLKSHNTQSHEGSCDTNQVDDENHITMDRIWLSPPHHQKIPRIGTSYQAAVLPLDQEH